MVGITTVKKTQLLFSNSYTDLEQRLMAVFLLLYQHSVFFQKCTQEQTEILNEVLLLVTATSVGVA